MKRRGSAVWNLAYTVAEIMLVAAPVLLALSVIIVLSVPGTRTPAAHRSTSRPPSIQPKAPQPSSQAHVPPAGKVYVGVSSAETGSSYAQFLQATGLRRVAIWDLFTSPNEDFQGILLHIKHSGAAAMVTWSFPGNGTMASIADGSYDGYIKRVAGEARHYARPLFIRLNWEFNGYWYPWSAQTRGGQLRPGNSPAQFVDAWRHVVSLFRAAPNATFVWCPTMYQVVHSSHYQLADWYPGNAYVGWVGLDAYLGSASWKYMQHGVAGLDDEYAFAKAHGKPVMIAEWALSRPGPGDNPVLVSQFWSWMASHPLVRAELWFNFNSKDTGRQYELSTFPRAARDLRTLLRQATVRDVLP